MNKMKTKIFSLIILFLISVGASAQIDRSKQPKPGPAPKISIEKPNEFKLNNGLTVLVVENTKLPRVSYSLTLDNGPIKEGDKAGISSIFSDMIGNGTTTIAKDEFNEEIDFLGATLSFGASSGFASSLSKYADRIVELMADAAMNPLFTEEEFEKSKERLLESLKADAKSVDAMADRVGSALAFGKDHPYGEFETEETINNINFQDIVNYHKTYFVPNKAYMVVVGDVTLEMVKEQMNKYFNPWMKSLDFETYITTTAGNVQFTQINFVDMPNAVQSNITLTSNVDLKMGDKDYHAVLIANKILGGGFESYLNMNLREEHGYTYGARSNVSASRFDAARFTASTAVRNAVTDSAVVETLKEIKRIKSEPVKAEAITNAKAKYVGDFVLALERPQTIASYALNIKLNNLPDDFYETYLSKINAVTSADVTRVANKYFTEDKARIIVVSKGSDVIENLEKTGIPVRYFDTYANTIDKPVFSKPLPEGVTAQTVIQNYLTAIGGKEKAKDVKSIYTMADVTIEGMPFAPKAELKMMAPNKQSMEMSIEGMGVVMKQKFDGTAGYREQQGMRMDLSEVEIAEQKADYPIFPELYYEASTLSLDGLTSIDGNDAYKVKVTLNGKDSFRYYDAKTNLLVRVESTTEAQGQSFTSVTDYGTYTDVNGLQIPYLQSIATGPQQITFKTTAVKLNEGVSDADFN